MSTTTPSVNGAAAADRPITRDDLVAGFRELQGEVEESAETAKTYAMAAVAVVAVVVITVAFLAGRRRGRKKSTVVEIRRI